MKNRVALARDVIAQIAIGRVVVTSGTYFDATLPKACSVKLGAIPNCRTCAIGTMFLTRLRTRTLSSLLKEGRANAYEDYDLIVDANGDQERAVARKRVSFGREVMAHELNALFDGGELWHIENAFEQYWVPDYDDAGERLVAIMRNIIRNRGMFLPNERRPPERAPRKRAPVRKKKSTHRATITINGVELGTATVRVEEAPARPATARSRLLR